MKRSSAAGLAAWAVIGWAMALLVAVNPQVALDRSYQIAEVVIIALAAAALTVLAIRRRSEP